MKYSFHSEARVELFEAIQYSFFVIALLFVCACSGGTSRKLSHDELLQINDMERQRKFASPRQQQQIDCQIRDIRISGGYIDPGCVLEPEKLHEAPNVIQDQKRIDQMIDKHLKDALDKAGK